MFYIGGPRTDVDVIEFKNHFTYKDNFNYLGLSYFLQKLYKDANMMYTNVYDSRSGEPMTNEFIDVFTAFVYPTCSTSIIHDMWSAFWDDETNHMKCVQCIKQGLSYDDNIKNIIPQLEESIISKESHYPIDVEPFKSYYEKNIVPQIAFMNATSLSEIDFIINKFFLRKMLGKLYIREIKD